MAEKPNQEQTGSLAEPLKSVERHDHAPEKDGVVALYVPASTVQQQASETQTQISYDPVRTWEPSRIQQPSLPSVKSLTCYFWAQGHCKWPADQCLYAHFDTGKTSTAPLQVENGRPAVAGKNAESGRPVYQDWRKKHTEQSIRPQIQQQLEHIKAKAMESSTTSSTPYSAGNSHFHGFVASNQPILGWPNSYSMPFPAFHQPEWHAPSTTYSPEWSGQYPSPAPYQPMQAVPSPLHRPIEPVETPAYQPFQAGPSPEYQPFQAEPSPGQQPIGAATQLDTSQHQRLCPRPADHMGAASVESLPNSLVARDVLANLANGIDSAVATLDFLRRSAAAESDKLARLVADDGFEISYVGTPIGERSTRGGLDLKHKVQGCAQNIEHMRDMLEREAEELKQLRARASTQMESIGAGSQLPSSWSKYATQALGASTETFTDLEQHYGPGM